MEKKKILIISIIAVAVLLTGTVAALLARGGIASFKERFASGEETQVQDETAPEETEAAAPRAKNTKPATVVAAVFEQAGEAVFAQIDSLPQLGFNCAVFDVTKENSKDAASALSYAFGKGIYSGIRTGAGFTDDDILSFIDSESLDFIIIAGRDETGGDYLKEITELSGAVREKDSGINIGIMPELVTKISDSVKSLAETSAADFIFVRQDSKASSSFKKAQDLYLQESLSVWMCHCLKGLGGYTASDAQTAIEEISVSSEMEQCEALAFYPFSDIANAEGAGAQAVKNYILKKENFLEDKDFEITNYKKTDITVESASITFRGTSSPNHELTCNGTKIERADNGDFSVDCKLSPGANKVVFSHKDKNYTYNVTYKVKILKSVSPSKAVSVPGGIDVEVTAVAISGANLTVSFNGSSYKMIADSGSSDDSSGTNSDFVTYYATLKTPEAKSSAQKLGTFKVSASYNGSTESKTGASVTVSAAEPVTVSPPEPVTTTAPPPETTTEKETESESTRTTHSRHPSLISQTSSTEEESSGSSTETETSATTATSATTSKQAEQGPSTQYDYTKNYGLGTARLAVITDEYVETFSGSSTSSKSVPDCSPLLKGTVDYITGSGTCADDEDKVTYYYLASGVKVPLFHEENTTAGSDTRITHLRVVEGYVMPKNNISVISCSNSGNRTIVKLSMNRLVAFNAKLTGQSYSSYNGRLVAVSGMDATGLEFTFSDTDKFTGSFSFMDSNIKSASASVSGSAATLKFAFQSAGRFYGYHYEYSNGILTITIKQKPSSISGYTIMLDPGHGGYDGGAGCVVSSSTWSEKKVNLAIAQRIKEYLENEGATVIMTRTGDSFLSLSSRNALVRSRLPDLFISVHCDSASSSSAYGTSAYYYRAYSQPLAKSIHQALVNAYASSVYPGEGKTKADRGTSFYAYKVARVEECPAVLIEYGFVSNTAECQKLQDASVRDALARATVTGIKNYIANS